MTARTVRKLTVWSEAEWAHVDGQARSMGHTPLRFVREAALGQVPTMPFAPVGGSAPTDGNRLRAAIVQRKDEAVIGVAALLTEIRALEELIDIGSDGRDALTRCAAAAENAILHIVDGSSDLDVVEWVVAAFRDTLVGMIRRAQSRGAGPPARVLEAVTVPLLTRLQSVACSSVRPKS